MIDNDPYIRGFAAYMGYDLDKLINDSNQLIRKNCK